MTLNKILADSYLDWVNNYLTVEKWAEHNGLEPEEAKQIFKVAKAIYNRNYNHNLSLKFYKGWKISHDLKLNCYCAERFGVRMRAGETNALVSMINQREKETKENFNVK